ncbi:uncharacterized protein LOC131595107 [Vicia villosa]|uniref:uncharacterized protein LOC131595107 n=1 Tax=Vicia villosa TaxID=3911 RepID=UPI00273BFF44|nr:uncharacterized protein LOC131595107 [Vicia villosa]
MQQAVVDPLLSPILSSDSASQRSAPEKPRFSDLRGLQWRINLGVLPSSSAASIDDLRRVTADCRRRYASLRRRLLAEAPSPKNGTNSRNLVMDNPLSQNPDSTWSRFFRNAELERLVDQDLSRLYPEHDSYFQSLGCQGMLRRILLLWCLKHPECGYRQGMHELMAPLLYVLQVDLERLSEVRKLYKDHFTDRFDILLCQENDLNYSFDFRKSPDMEDEIGSHVNAMKAGSLDELEPEIQSIVLLSDAYGAEGELGIVLSEKFMEHDAYCMFDALMKGANGSVAMADFFVSSPVASSHTGLPPVIEASMALYHLLSLADSSLHNHLLDLGVEPQYFYLRWLRVLFGREFSLDKLLIIWDEIFASDNSKMENSAEDNIDYGFRILHSPRGAFISSIAVAMILYLRSSLLATENPTTCLQRLLNFPENITIEKILKKAKSLQDLALSIDISSSSHLLLGSRYQSKTTSTRSVTLPSESVSPKTPLNFIPDSYWEEKWRNAQKAEERKQDGAENQVPTRKKGWTEKMKLRLRRTESDPPPSRVLSGQRGSKPSFRRSLLEDLRKALGAEENTEHEQHHDEIISEQDNLSEAVEVERQDSGSNSDNNYSSDDKCPSGNSGRDEDSSIYSDSVSPPNEANDPEIASEKNSATSFLSLDECNETSDTCHIDSPLPISDPPENMPPTSECNNDNQGNHQCNETSDTIPCDSPSPISDPPQNLPETSGCDNDDAGGSSTAPKERKQNKFQWFWNFGRNTVDANSEKVGSAAEATKSANNNSNQSNSSPPPASPAVNGHCSSVSSRGDSVDQNVMGTLKNIGQSMLDHIQVIESVFQPDRGQGASSDNLSKNILVGKGQVTAMTALKELRKISNLLSEM